MFYMLKPFADVLDIYNGRNQKKVENPNGKYPIYGSGGIMGFADDFLCPANTVLIGRKGSINNPIYVETPVWNVDTAFGLIAKNGVLLPKYLYYFCVHFNFEKLNTTVTIPSLTKANLLKIQMPVPNITDQKIIAKTLDRIQALIAHRKQQLAKLDELVKARFVEMFGDFKTNSMGWTIAKFTDIASIDGNMTTDFEKYANYPHIGIDSIEKDTGILRGYRTVSEDNVVSGKYVFTPFHIIYSKIRPNLNKVALPDFEGVCSADAYPILPNPENCNRVFLAYVMRSSYFLDYILQFCNRTNMPKVNRKEVSGFTTPLPPINLQNQFADFVEQIDKSKVAVQKALDEAQLLFDSLMQEYFG